MKCSIQGCPGHYEKRPIVHTVRKADDVFVFEDVPADVCTICSDTLMTPDTVRHLERLMRRKTKPERFAPVYAYA
jgi:hypothetical protein